MDKKISKPLEAKEEPTWYDIVKIVDMAHIQQSQSLKQQENNRKRAYKNELDMQMKQMQKYYSIEQKRKERERTEIQQLVKAEQNMKVEKRTKRMKTQQIYQVENLQLTKSASKNTRDQMKYEENPLVNLVDKQDERHRQTKMNFRMQNDLNSIQVEINRNKKQRQRKYQQETKQKFVNFVEKEFFQKEKNRQNFKNKYLSLKSWEKANLQTLQSESIEKKYIKFLDHQVQEQQKRKYLQKNALDNRAKEINKHTQISDSSPAYLGRKPYSHDRRKQLHILDNSLHNNPKIIRSFSQLQRTVQAINSSQSKEPNSEKIMSHNSSNVKILPPINPINRLKNTFQLQKCKLTEELRKQSIRISNLEKNSSFNQKSSPPKQPKKYIRYDFITGSNKQIII